MHSYIVFFEAAAFIACIAAWNVIKKSKYLRLYALLLFVIVFVEINENSFQSGTHKNNAWLYNIQIPIQYIIYSFILYYAFVSRFFKKAIIAAIVIFIIVTVITQIYYTRPGAFNSWSYSAGSIIFIIGILIKFYEMLQHPEEYNFIRNPFFYMLFAFLLFNVGTLPYFAMGNWLWFYKNDKNTVLLLANVMSVLNYILYSTYTIAFIWMRKKGSC